MLLVAILAAFTGVIGTSLYEVTRSMHKNQVSRNKFTQYHLLTLSLRSIISRPDVCTLALKNQVFNPSESKSSVRVVSSVFEEKKFIGNIEDISNSKFILLNQGFTSDKFLAGSSAKLRTYKANLQVWLPHNTGGSESFNYEKLKIPIPLYVNIDEHNNINSCYGVYSKAALCERYWKSWDQSESDLDIQCNPDRQCILYSSTTCDPPSIKVAIGNAETTTITTPGTSVLDTYASVGRATDKAELALSDYKKIMEAFKETLEEIRDSIEETKDSLDKLKSILDTETQNYNQAQAALNACRNACYTCLGGCSSDPDDPPCNCPCDCSRAGHAASEAAKRVSQVQKELDEIVQLHDDMTQILAGYEKMEDMGEFQLKKMELGQKLAKKHLLELKASKSSHKKWSDIDPKLLGEVQKDIDEFELERKRISDTYTGGKDPLSDVTVKRRPDDLEHLSIFSPDYSGHRKELKRIVNKGFSTGVDRAKQQLRKEGIKKSGMAIDVSDLVASEIIYTVYDIEKDILGRAPKKTEIPKGPITDLPGFRDGIPGFNKSLSKAMIQNQLLYSTTRRHFNSYQTVRQFTSPGTTVTKSEPKYMCLWCNEKRKEQLKNQPTDSVLSKN